MTKHHTNRFGWDRIAKVEVEQFRDENDRIEFGHVWIITTRGDIYVVDTRHGETEESNAARYLKQGWTDERCTLYRAAA